MDQIFEIFEFEKLMNFQNSTLRKTKKQNIMLFQFGKF